MTWSWKFGIAALLAIGAANLAAADDHFTLSDDSDLVIQQVGHSLGGGGGKSDDACGCDAKGGKGECTCYAFGPGEAFTLFGSNECNNISAGGWTQVGYHDKQTSLSMAPNDALAFNDHANRVNIHQQWLWIEKALSGDACSWDWGFRADIMYGTDAAKTQSFGGTGWDADPAWDRGGGYGWAMPQLYVELGRGDFSVKVGHFYTLVGYEVVTAPDNFFYSHSLTMFNSEPFTHSGVLATQKVNDNLEVYGGWTAGWDTGFESNNGGSSFLGGFSYAVNDDVQFTYISTAGDFGAIGQQAYSHSVVVDMTLTERLNYVFQTDYKQVNSTSDDDVGINQYLIYNYNDCLGVGGRLEWWKDDGQSHYEGTFGINYRPHANIVIRPEIRRDWKPFNNFEEDTFGIDTILVY